MKKIDYIKDIPRTPGSKVKIGGRVSRVNDLKSARFVWVRDITGAVQLTVLKGKTDPKMLKEVEELMPNYFVIVEGVIPAEIKVASGIEIIPERIEIVSKPQGPAPIDIEGIHETGIDKRLDWRALDLRSPRQMAIFLVQSKLLESMQKYLYSKKFMQTFTPSVLGVSQEGGSEVFSFSHFGKNAYLRQDPQLHRQLLMLAGFEKIYEIGPSWRAEASNTPVHLTEHRTCAAEISFIDDEKDVMEVEESLIVHAVKTVSQECEEELKILGVNLEVPRTPFPVLEFPKIYDILEELGFHPKRGEEDYNKQGEEALAKYVKEKHKSDFFFVNRFPYAIKPFYVMRVDDEPQWARSIDLIYNGLELSSGGQREHRYEKIVEQAKDKGMDVNELKWFTEFFKYGAPPHGGFSIGLERLTARLLNIQNVRETALFPRAPDRLVP
jgi:aspartyl-tRNA synthetase